MDEDKFYQETHEKILREYPYTIPTRNRGEANFNRVFLNFTDSVNHQPGDVAWAQRARDILLSEYSAVSGTMLLYFKTEADRTYFLLRFS